MALDISSSSTMPVNTSWRSHPDGQGTVVLKFLSDPDNLTKLVANLDKLYKPTDGERDGINAEVESLRRQAAAQLSQVYRGEIQVTEEEHLKLIQNSMGNSLRHICPSLSRDTGAGILYLIANADKPIPVHLDLDFIADTLMCEWAYVVDVDAGALEVFWHEWVSGKRGSMSLTVPVARFGPGLLRTWPLSDTAKLGHSGILFIGDGTCMIGSGRTLKWILPEGATQE
ncbi:hypothetical protein VMCG_04906 [Cytospora schulzeri]|uniref:Uncharacterized protein n=1 Tax=Cytospora schulzeri TaxID=448051 RepID=A0A423WNN8_9PEZI|nr:hypothetical protein VMCG_04906 [Valsa malicola]